MMVVVFMLMMMLVLMMVMMLMFVLVALAGVFMVLVYHSFLCFLLQRYEVPGATGLQKHASQKSLPGRCAESVRLLQDFLNDVENNKIHKP